MEEKKEFQPQIIGVDQRKKKEALRAWEALTDVSSDALCDIISFIDGEDMETEQFLNVVSLEPKQAITHLFELSGQTIEGTNTDVAVKIGLISNDYHSEVEKLLHSFHKAKREAERLFQFDLAKLRDEQGLFSLTDEFRSALEEHCTVYTQSAKQNEALDKLKQLIDSLNYFSDAGMVKPAYGTNSLGPLMQGIQSTTDRKGFEPVLNLFKISRWNFLFR